MTVIPRRNWKQCLCIFFFFGGGGEGGKGRKTICTIGLNENGE